MTTLEAKSRKVTPTTPPISILPTDAAKSYTHFHPIFLLAFYYFRFPSLVADPISTLLTDLIPISLLQLSYVTVCLPAHKSSNVPQPAFKPPKSGIRKRSAPLVKNHIGLTSTIIPALLALTLTIFPSIPILTIILILFGAPLTTHHSQTILCAAHISLLAVFPLFYTYGVSGKIWREISGAMLAFDEVWGATAGCVVGAWLGAVPIPLDWDREWQKWPITIVTGAYGGYVVGKLAGKYLLEGKRIEFD